MCHVLKYRICANLTLHVKYMLCQLNNVQTNIVFNYQGLLGVDVVAVKDCTYVVALRQFKPRLNKARR